LQGIFTSEELQRYTKKFLCGLYIMAHGNLNNSMKAFDVFFKNVSTEAYERPSFGYQATNEIVQNLVQNGIISEQQIERKPSILNCPRCSLVNAIENKYCSKCSYPLVLRTQQRYVMTKSIGGHSLILCLVLQNCWLHVSSWFYHC
jgi:RNase P subunit RPR2